MAIRRGRKYETFDAAGPQWILRSRLRQETNMGSRGTDNSLLAFDLWTARIAGDSDNPHPFVRKSGKRPRASEQLVHFGL